MLPFSIMSVKLLFHPALNSKVGEILEKNRKGSKQVEEGIWKKSGRGEREC